MDENAVQCQRLGNTGDAQINIRNFCDDYWIIAECPPLYLSVHLAGASVTTAVCTGKYYTIYLLRVNMTSLAR